MIVEVREIWIKRLNQPPTELHHIDISTNRHIISLNMLLNLLMKKFKMLTLTYILMDMLILTMHVKFYLI